jgi:predicted nucleic acid-binding protein
LALILDTSAFLKLFVAEEHSSNVRQWVIDADEVLASCVAYVEAYSAIARLGGAGSLSKRDAAAVRDQIESGWQHITSISLDIPVAGAVATRHRLRTLDAIHLAAALTYRDKAPSEHLAFCCFDARLNAAAAAEGLRVLTA